MGLTTEEKQAIISYRMEKSRKTMVEAVDNATLGHWSLVANRLYYSAFHAVSALLISKGLSAKTHGGAMSLLGKEFVKTGLLSFDEGDLYSRLYNMRQSGDYDDLFDWTKEDVSPLISRTEKLIDKIASLL